MSTQARFADADGLNAFLHEHEQAAGGLLVYMGTEVKRLSEQIVAVPWECLVH